MTVFISAETETFELHAVYVAREGDIEVWEIIFKTFAFGSISADTIDDFVPIFNNDGVVLEEFTGFGGFNQAIKAGDIALSSRKDVAIVKLGSQHGGKFASMFSVFALLEGGRNRAMVATQFTGFVNLVDFRPVKIGIFGLEAGDFGVSEFEADLGSITTVDRITNLNVFAEHFFHIASVIFVNTLHNIAIIVIDVHIFNFLILGTSASTERIVLGFADFGVGFLMDGNVTTPFTVFSGGIFSGLWIAEAVL